MQDKNWKEKIRVLMTDPGIDDKEKVLEIVELELSSQKAKYDKEAEVIASESYENGKHFTKAKVLEILEGMKRDVNTHNVSSKDQKIKNRIAWNTALDEAKLKLQDL